MLLQVIAHFFSVQPPLLPDATLEYGHRKRQRRRRLPAGQGRSCPSAISTRSAGALARWQPVCRRCQARAA